jgi:hypothetical protein
MGYYDEGLPKFAQSWVDGMSDRSQRVVRQAQEVIHRPSMPEEPAVDLRGWPVRR